MDRDEPDIVDWLSAGLQGTEHLAARRHGDQARKQRPIGRTQRAHGLDCSSFHAHLCWSGGERRQLDLQFPDRGTACANPPGGLDGQWLLDRAHAWTSDAGTSNTPDRERAFDTRLPGWGRHRWAFCLAVAGLCSLCGWFGIDRF